MLVNADALHNSESKQIYIHNKIIAQNARLQLSRVSTKQQAAQTHMDAFLESTEGPAVEP